MGGLLFAGAILGPFGLGLVRSVHSIEVLAEVGVVLLLFSIGLEFSLTRLRDIFRQVALGGVLQVGLTIAVTAAVVVGLGQSVGRGIFYGFVFALSSTAIVLRTLVERRELDAPHGRFIVGTLIFQDLCVVPMGVGVSVSPYVVACEKVLKEAGLKTKLHAYGTNIEGEWDEVMDVIKRACEAVDAPRVGLTLKADIRPGVTGAITSKVASVERHLAGG